MTTSSKLIDFLGGTFAVANMLGIKPPSVSKWRTEGIPRGRLAELAIQTGRAVRSLNDLSENNLHHAWPELAEQEKV